MGTQLDLPRPGLPWCGSHPPVPAATLFVLSGPSGVGKDAVIERLKGLGTPVHVLVTYTTRRRRPGEVPGIDYHFVSEREFLARRDRGEFLEWVRAYNNYYGTPESPLRSALDAGTNVLLKIDVVGAARVRHQFPDAVLVFLAPSDPTRMIERLRRRRTERPAELEARVQQACREMSELRNYDYLVVNPEGHPEEAAVQLHAIVTAEGLRVKRLKGQQIAPDCAGSRPGQRQEPSSVGAHWLCTRKLDCQR